MTHAHTVLKNSVRRRRISSWLRPSLHRQLPTYPVEK
jgi:hypothetical protein